MSQKKNCRTKKKQKRLLGESFKPFEISRPSPRHFAQTIQRFFFLLLPNRKSGCGFHIYPIESFINLPLKKTKRTCSANIWYILKKETTEAIQNSIKVILFAVVRIENTIDGRIKKDQIDQTQDLKKRAFCRERNVWFFQSKRPTRGNSFLPPSLLFLFLPNKRCWLNRRKKKEARNNNYES